MVAIASQQGQASLTKELQNWRRVWGRAHLSHDQEWSVNWQLTPDYKASEANLKDMWNHIFHAKVK